MASTALPAAATHAERMDATYRWQRHIYDITRKYFLFGRDRLIGDLGLAAGGSVVELACGTGRNLAVIGRRWPQARLYGVDISAEMLRSAGAKLGSDAVLALGDACALDAAACLGQPSFERVILSYALSMIPDWQGALAQGAALLAPGGALHVVDFGPALGLPAPARAALTAWLARFGVTMRAALPDAAQRLAEACGLALECHEGPLGYYRYLVLRRPAA